MILLDSNILIYLRDPKWGENIMDKLEGERLATCNIVIAEVLGYRELEKSDAKYYEQFFETMKNYLFDDKITKIVVGLRIKYAIQLPDAIIAATALANNLSLCTHNTEDFFKIPDLPLIDPLIT